MPVADPGERTARSARLPRSARRRQLLGAAQEVFVAQGYHAAAMDDIADRAGVSKPVLYQHFPGKLDLYLALLEEHAEAMVAAVREALDSTSDNKQRVAATIEAYFRFVDEDGGAFRLVFESDLTNQPEVRERVEGTTLACAELISEVIREDAGLPKEQSRLLAVGLVGHGPGVGPLLAGRRRVDPPRRGVAPARQPVLARHRRLPPPRAVTSSPGSGGPERPRRAAARPTSLTAPSAAVDPEVQVEVRIGVQHATRELVIESAQTTDAITDAVSAALAGKTEVLSLEDERGRRIVVPAAKLAYVEIGEPESRRVGFGAM